LTTIPAGTTTTITDSDIDTVFVVEPGTTSHATINLPHCNNGTRYDGKKLSFIVYNIFKNQENGGNGFGPTIQTQGTDKLSDYGDTDANGTVVYSTHTSINSGASAFAYVCFAGGVDGNPGVWFQVSF
jgi:hypothetical protein